MDKIIIQPINIFLKHLNRKLIGNLKDRWKFPFTRYGQVCHSPCEYNGSYGWCNSGKDWDYCSPIDYNTEASLTISGQTCDNDCAKHNGTSYYWCKVDKDWNYCSSFTQKGRFRSPSYPDLTISGWRCLDKCVPWKDGYKTCTTKLSDGGLWDYCNTDSRRTYLGKSCTSACKYYKPSGPGYNYCETGSSSRDWDYCSPSVHGNDDCKDEMLIDLNDPILTAYGWEFLIPR